MKNLKDVLPEKAKNEGKPDTDLTWPHYDFGYRCGYNKAIDDCHAKLGEVVECIKRIVQEIPSVEGEMISIDDVNKALDQLQAEHTSGKIAGGGEGRIEENSIKGGRITSRR